MRVSALIVCLLAGAAHAEPAAWHVTGNGAELWLLGSVHYLREQDYPLPKRVDELYALADALVMELDLDDIDAANVRSQFFSAALLPAGQTLGDVLDPDLYALAERQGRLLGVDMALLERFEPWLIAITFMDLGMSQLGYQAERGLEHYLLAKAQADAKEIHGLETLQTQIRVFDDLSLSEQQLLLSQTLRELESPDAALGELISAWRDGSLQSLTDTLMQDFNEFPGLYDTLILTRNRAWLTVLEHLMSEQRPLLVVVGALHLVGDGSVIELLKSRGYDVSPLSNR